MIHESRRLVGFIAVCLGAVFGSLAQSASALDTPNTLFTIDGMTLNHQGLFRAANPADGYNTFSFGPFAATGNFTTLGRYKSFHFLTTGIGDKGISSNVRNHSDTPDHWNGASYQIPDRSGGALDLTNAYYPTIDRAGFGGQIFDPSEYHVEVKFKPNAGVGGPIFDNTAPLFTVGLDQMDGFVWDAEAGAYKRANEAFTYNIGSVAEPINTWYATAEKDANGFATYSVPVSTPNFSQRGFYFKFGDNAFRTGDVVTGGGRVQNADLTWSDVTDGLDPMSFGGGATDPARLGSQLKVPNGVPLMSFGAPNAETGLSVQINYITLKRNNPGEIVARIDKNSGVTYRFGSGFTRSTTAAPIPVPGDPYGLGYIPSSTDQISRFDENGMTNLIFNMREPDPVGPNGPETHRFVIREGAAATSFDGTTAIVNVRAKLLAGNTATTLRIVAKDLDGNDDAAGKGADEYTYNLPLSMFNSSTFTTVPIMLADFALSTFVPPAPPNGSSGPFGFANAGDLLRTDFNLYEFAGLIAPNTGLLKMELVFMEIRLPSTLLVGDYNDDNKVDAADYTVWRDHLGGPGTSLLNRDPNNGSGVVSTADYASWKTHFGQSQMGSGSLTATSVPESGTLSLVALLLAAAAVVRPKR